MKLNQYQKRAIINAIMNDVPQIDYTAQAQAIMMARSIELLPPGVKAFYERGNGEWLKTMTVRAPYASDLNPHLFQVYHEFYWLTIVGVEPSPLKAEDFEPLIPLAHAKAEQYTARKALLDQVTANVNSCSTDKALIKRFPEFGRYLPKVDGATANLPAETSLITNLMQLGWAPK